MQIERRTDAFNVTWSASTDSAEVAGLAGLAGFAIYLPATFAGSALSFKAELPDGTFAVVHNNGSDLSVAVAAGKLNVLPAELFGGFPAGKFVSTDAETGTGKLLGSS